VPFLKVEEVGVNQGLVSITYWFGRRFGGSGFRTKWAAATSRFFFRNRWFSPADRAKPIVFRNSGYGGFQAIGVVAFPALGSVAKKHFGFACFGSADFAR